MIYSKETIAAFEAIATATLTTVLLKKGLRNVWMRGAFPLRPGQVRVAGPAFTLRFVPAREDLATPESWSSPVSTRTAIEAMSPGCFAVVDAMGVLRSLMPWVFRTPGSLEISFVLEWLFGALLEW